MVAALERHDESHQRGDSDIEFLAHHLVGAGGEVERTGKLRVLQDGQVRLARQFAHRHRRLAAPLGEHDGRGRKRGVVSQRDGKMHRVDDEELRILHRLADAAARKIALALAAGHLHFRRTFGLLVLVLEVLQAHLEPFVALDLAPNNYRVMLGGLVLAQGTVRPNKLLAINTGDVRTDNGVQGEATLDPSFGCPALWIDQAVRDHAVAEGFMTVDASTVIATHANQELLEFSHQLLGPEEVRAMIDDLKDRAPALIEAVHPDPLSLAALTRIFRALIADGISLAHPQPLMTSLALALQKTQDFDALIDAVRSDLGARLVARICEPGERLKVVTLDAALESAILGGMVDPSTGQPLIEPDCGGMIIARVNAAIEETGGPVALIVQPPARRALAGLLRQRAQLSGAVDQRIACQPAGRSGFGYRRRRTVRPRPSCARIL
ncbi:MAG: hypothetical protein CL955_03015 [Erythrobacteraceae bacterium]|nr:hypothetical protein [Erythrobacteraceae bacterium]